MAALGIPSEVLVGLCVGGSASFMILVELPSDSPLARELMKTRGRRIALWSICKTVSVLRQLRMKGL